MPWSLENDNESLETVRVVGITTYGISLLLQSTVSIKLETIIAWIKNKEPFFIKYRNKQAIAFLISS